MSYMAASVFLIELEYEDLLMRLKISTLFIFILSLSKSKLWEAKNIVQGIVLPLAGTLLYFLNCFNLIKA